MTDGNTPTAAELIAQTAATWNAPREIDGTSALVLLREIDVEAIRGERSLWGLARAKSVPFLDAMVTLGRLEDAGIIENPQKDRAPSDRLASKGLPDMVRLTAKGQLMLGNIQAPRSTATDQPDPRPRAPHMEPAAIAAAVSLAEPRVVADDLRQTIMVSLLQHSEQSMYRLTHRHGAALLDVAVILKGLSDQGLANVRSMMSNEVVQLTSAGRDLARRIATPELSGRGVS